nr:toprim domain-containing protein [Gluconacetobacter tumulisoli]
MHDAGDLSRCLAQQAEAVCRHYLSNGRRHGNYWQVGDARNALGRSLFVRLHGPESGKGAAGKWTDAASGEHGDLLDIIREVLGLVDFRDVADEARAFLALPRPEPMPRQDRRDVESAPSGSTGAARRLFHMARPLSGTIVEAYLRKRGITALHEADALRCHPACYYRPEDGGPMETWPAMIAAVTDAEGHLTGVHRTWLAPDGDKAPVAFPRRAMGALLGHGVRFGVAGEIMAVGEGIETVLALRSALPIMAMVACLSSAHLSAFLFPSTLRRLYIARDRDPAGDHASMTLHQRADQAGIEALTLNPRLGDFNDDLQAFGRDALRTTLRAQLAPQDVARFIENVGWSGLPPD